MNELHLRALFCHFDGTTSGPNSFKGSIGKSLGEADLDDLPIVRFKRIPCMISAAEDLSTDQAQLYAFTVLVSTGVKLPAVDWKLGKLCHSRWLPLATRALARYFKTREPSTELTTLATYITQVYVPSWFQIKKYENWQSGPKNLYSIMERVKAQSREVIAVVKPAVQRNAFFALSDNLLAAMLSDESETPRNQAVLLSLR
jgi:hypothetical protein